MGYMLECQPVCSFARESAMIGMAAKTDAPELQHPKLYHTLLRRAAARKPKPYDDDDDDFTFAVILPGGAWCLITDLDQATIDDADKLSHGEALTALVAGEFDVCVPC